jgi:hypothetical protein
MIPLIRCHSLSMPGGFLYRPNSEARQCSPFYSQPVLQFCLIFIAAFPLGVWAGE